ncbi:hypothetical protein KIW84_045567 [Lathyrus oleraceus]|uniref:Uncharacterized protein n=1 Tax=Pisum sativum TaxID=3888 RepID=A0A9D5AWW0_PEA|nr:hypothetical protein KIW84_045567 [Pisum sativum]
MIANPERLMIKYGGNVCPNIQLVLEKNKKFIEDWTPTWHGDDDMAIFDVTNDGELMVNPALRKRAFGRPKKMRKKTNDEPKSPHVMPRKLVTITCHKCGSMGHNMRTRKGKSATDRDMPKDGNKTKKLKTTKVKKKKSKSATQPTQKIGCCSQGPQPTQE